MINKITYIPKGSMCMVCKHKSDIGCSKRLKFENMQSISKRDNEGFVVVKCEGFEQIKPRG